MVLHHPRSYPEVHGTASGLSSEDRFSSYISGYLPVLSFEEDEKEPWKMLPASPERKVLPAPSTGKALSAPSGRETPSASPSGYQFGPMCGLPHWTVLVFRTSSPRCRVGGIPSVGFGSLVGAIIGPTPSLPLKVGRPKAIGLQLVPQLGTLQPEITLVLTEETARGFCSPLSTCQRGRN